MRRLGQPIVVRSWWDYVASEDDVADYRQVDYDNAMDEIQHLVDRVNNGDLSFSNNEGYHIPKDIDLEELYEGDNYHSKFHRINAVYN